MQREKKVIVNSLSPRQPQPQNCWLGQFYSKDSVMGA